MRKCHSCVSEAGCENVRTTGWPECVDEQQQLNCVKSLLPPCCLHWPCHTLSFCFRFISIAHFRDFFFKYSLVHRSRRALHMHIYMQSFSAEGFLSVWNKTQLILNSRSKQQQVFKGLQQTSSQPPSSGILTTTHQHSNPTDISCQLRILMAFWRQSAQGNRKTRERKHLLKVSNCCTRLYS